MIVVMNCGVTITRVRRVRRVRQEAGGTQVAYDSYAAAQRSYNPFGSVRLQRVISGFPSYCPLVTARSLPSRSQMSPLVSVDILVRRPSICLVLLDTFVEAGYFQAYRVSYLYANGFEALRQHVARISSG